MQKTVAARVASQLKRLAGQQSLADRAVTQGEAELRRGNFVTNASLGIPQDEPKFTNEPRVDFLRRSRLLSHSSPRAIVRLEYLRDAADRETKLNRVNVDELLELQQERRERDLRVRELTLPEFAARSGNDAVPENHPSVTQAHAHLAETDRKLAENERRTQELKKSSIRPVTLKVEKFLSENRKEWQDASAKLDLLERGHDALVSDISRTKSELQTTKDAPPSATEVKASIEADVNARAAKGRPIVTNGKINWPRNDQDMQVNGFAAGPDAYQLQAFVTNRSNDALAVTCWLFRDQIIKELTAKLPKGGLSTEEKRTRIAELETQLFNLERAECELVWQSNGALPFRRDANPIALLGISHG